MGSSNTSVGISSTSFNAAVEMIKKQKWLEEPAACGSLSRLLSHPKRALLTFARLSEKGGNEPGLALALNVW